MGKKDRSSTVKRTSRRHVRLIQFFEERMKSGSEVVAKQAAERLCELLMHIDNLQEQRHERELRLKLAVLRAEEAQNAPMPGRPGRRPSTAQGTQAEAVGPQDGDGQDAVNRAWDEILGKQVKASDGRYQVPR